MPHRVATDIYKAVMAAKHILLIPHANPDGDALGSVASFMQFLRSIDKDHTTFCSTEISSRMHFLPHIQYIIHEKEQLLAHEYDVVIVFDSGDLRYAGVDTYLKTMDPQPMVINIDHHVTNEMYGELNMVHTQASSTTQILYDFFTYNEIPIDPDMATCLLTGLITDTDNFTNAATSILSLNISSELIRKGANLNLIKGWVFKDKSIDALKLWGTMLSRFEKHVELDIVYTYLKLDDLQEHHVTQEQTEGMANFLNNIEDGKVGLIVQELENGKIKGSFRTTHDDVDVGAMAVSLGGGGHKKAAGFTIDGPLSTALSHIFDTLLSLDKIT
ncbi:MAG: hypothetical protein HN726_03195 [Candidatus Magasanikbacteria bacterium]|jgi:bifunctional oligoribonuclease and PAP phosphatase NrnA|nr:hypothetical protein [Candidatus Magasanikbacteria bacterium]MBT4541999.1 hypothetical protein [Candidatus Magasanikbacteria bacterium]MBT6253362.1 hypothetical protein [Candidatus Magasanikbacteria bacterium]MBT6334956.1 hypothetical protein [Candidatus Magasanikbacteria bacterium]MBT7755178.1 hypothetical protein [Candidatus Magasanikbacteria bacterium]